MAELTSAIDVSFLALTNLKDSLECGAEPLVGRYLYGAKSFTN
ncbi:hypothetical protein BH18ACI4_BH18ACI4_12700 [soil metagenome]